MSKTDYASLVKSDRVHTALYTDPDIFDQEIERIFGQTWVWVAHDSELPGKNDWITTHVGRQPVIVNRDKHGTVRVMLNRCRHRGATICERKKGNSPGFVCPYHAWTYRLDGQLLALPERRRFFRGLVHWIGFRTARIDFDVDRREVGQGSELQFAGPQRLLRLALRRVLSSE